MKRLLLKTLLGAALGLGPALAAPALPQADCRAQPTAARCVWPTARNGVRVGQGTALHAANTFVTVTGGFVSASTLFLGVEYGSDQDALGAVLAINLRTGDRRLISGDTGRERRLPGGPNRLNMLRDVQPLPDGRLAVLVKTGGTRPTSVVAVDPATGRQRPLWSAMAGVCVPTDTRPFQPTPFTFQTGPDGSLYLLGDDIPAGSGYGVYAVKPPYTHCQRLSGFGPEGRNLAGSGFTQAGPGDLVPASARPGHTLYSLLTPNPEGSALIAWNLASGTRRLVSLAARTPGQGRGAGAVPVGQQGLAFSGGALYSSGVTEDAGRSYFTLTRIDPATGHRTLLTARTGPLASNIHDEHQTLFAIPGARQLVVQMQGGLFLFDPVTRTSLTLSY